MEASTNYITPVKSESDDREYRYVVLPNDLHVLLVSDPETDKAAAACDVHVGSMCDPADVLGLAHFLEHMLFMGSQKYPDENAYEKYLSEKGGSSNAYTSSENTNFYFDITKEYLRPALDIFAQFFISPLMSASATEREMRAVHSENKKNEQADSWRIQQLLRSNANPAHPYAQFSTGNLETLDTTPKAAGKDTRQELLAFHDKYYSANLMKVSVLGKESLDTLEQWVRECFEPVVNKKLKPVSFAPTPVYTPEQVGRVFSVVPVKDLRRVSLLWPLPPTHEQYDVKPVSYVSHLLGHEGEGSVFALLKKKGWATSLVSGASNTTKEFDFFKIDVDLTEEGFQHREDILDIIFQYIHMLNAQGPQEWIYNEIKIVSEIEFANANKRKPISYVSSLATSMHWYKPQDVLSAIYLHERFDAKLIKDIQDCLSPQNLVVLYISKEFNGKTDKVEKWYGTQYSVEPISAGLLQRLNSVASIDPELHLPARNEFIPDDLSLRPVPEEWQEKDGQMHKVPKLARDGPQSKVWFMQDATFQLPKGSLYLQIMSTEAYASPQNTTKANMLSLLVQDALNEFAYDAQIAGLDYKIEFNVEGLLLVIMGFSQKIPVLLHKIIAQLMNDGIPEDRFAVIKEKLLRDFVNFSREAPHSHSRYYMMMCSMHPRWGWEERIDILKELTLQDVQRFLPIFIQTSRLEWLIHGNFTEAEAIAMVDATEQQLHDPARPQQHYAVPWYTIQRTVKFKKGMSYLMQRPNINPDDANSALYTWYEAGHLENTVLMARLSLLDELLREPAYDQLRTKEQLGYIVWSSLRNACGITGWRVTIQSSEYDAQHLDARTEAFIESATNLLEAISDEDFQSYVEALIAKNLEKPHSLFALSMMMWDEIGEHRYVFDRREKECEELRRTTKADIITAFKQTVADKATRRKVSIQLFAKQHKVPEQIKTDTTRVYIDDIYAFRETMPLYAPFGGK